MATKSPEAPARVTRVVTFPVREVVEPALARTLDTFRPAWQLSTALANWAQLELVRRDVRRTPDMERLPKYDRERIFGTVPRRFARKAKGAKAAQAVGAPQTGSLYDLFNRECPFRDRFAGCAVSARDVLKAVEDAWRDHPSFGRFAVLWRGEARPCVFRFPYPWPVPAQNLKVYKGGAPADGPEDTPESRLLRRAAGAPLVSLTMPGGRVVVRLANDPQYHRQLRQFETLLSDVSRLRQARVTGRYSGGRLVGADVRLVGSFDAKGDAGGYSALVQTGPDALVTAAVAGDSKPYVYNGDELRQVIAVHDGWRHRLSTDLKYEKRWPAHVRRRRVEGPRVRAKYKKSHDRLRTARQTVAAQLVGWLTRRQVGTLDYDDADKRFLPRFDWTGLRECVRHKCEEAGIEFHHTPRETVEGAEEEEEGGEE